MNKRMNVIAVAGRAGLPVFNLEALPSTALQLFAKVLAWVPLGLATVRRLA